MHSRGCIKHQLETNNKQCFNTQYNNLNRVTTLSRNGHKCADQDPMNLKLDRNNLAPKDDSVPKADLHAVVTS